MVNSLWKTSSSSPPCEGGERGVVVNLYSVLNVNNYNITWWYITTKIRRCQEFCINSFPAICLKNGRFSFAFQMRCNFTTLSPPACKTWRCSIIGRGDFLVHKGGVITPDGYFDIILQVFLCWFRACSLNRNILVQSRTIEPAKENWGAVSGIEIRLPLAATFFYMQ